MHPIFDPIEIFSMFLMLFGIMFRYLWPLFLGVIVFGYINMKIARREATRREEERQAFLDLAASVKRMEENQRMKK